MSSMKCYNLIRLCFKNPERPGRERPPHSWTDCRRSETFWLPWRQCWGKITAEYWCKKGPKLVIFVFWSIALFRHSCTLRRSLPGVSAPSLRQSLCATSCSEDWLSVGEHSFPSMKLQTEVPFGDDTMTSRNGAGSVFEDSGSDSCSVCLASGPRSSESYSFEDLEAFVWEGLESRQRVLFGI